MSALPPKADVVRQQLDVRFVPKADILQCSDRSHLLGPTDYEITEAEDGEQALAVVAKARPDLILMGIQLPIMDGYEVTR